MGNLSQGRTPTSCVITSKRFRFCLSKLKCHPEVFVWKEHHLCSQVSVSGASMHVLLGVICLFLCLIYFVVLGLYALTHFVTFSTARFERTAISVLCMFSDFDFDFDLRKKSWWIWIWLQDLGLIDQNLTNLF